MFLTDNICGATLIKEKWAQVSTKEALDVARLALFVQAPCSVGLSLTPTFSGSVSGKGVSRLPTACPQTTQFPYKQKPAKLPNQGRLQVCGEGVCICIDLELQWRTANTSTFFKAWHVCPVTLPWGHPIFRMRPKDVTPEIHWPQAGC